MSIQSKVRLLGNLTVDNIYRIDNWTNQGTSNKFVEHKTSLGAIGNMVSPFRDHQINIFVESVIGKDTDGKLVKDYLDNNKIPYLLHESNLSTSHALILSSLQDQERTSFVHWGCGLVPFLPSRMDSDWSHICYLDIMCEMDLNNVRNCSKIVSADLCLSNPTQENIRKTINKFSYLDYLFISESEIGSFITKISEAPQFLKATNLKNLIFHTRTKTFLANQKECFEVNNDHPSINNIDVLGAGDIYCANFIVHQLEYRTNLQESALYAHQQTTKFIWIKNEKV